MSLVTSWHQAALEGQSRKCHEFNILRICIPTHARLPLDQLRATGTREKPGWPRIGSIYKRVSPAQPWISVQPSQTTCQAHVSNYHPDRARGTEGTILVLLHKSRNADDVKLCKKTSSVVAIHCDTSPLKMGVR